MRLIALILFTASVASAGPKDWLKRNAFELVTSSLTTGAWAGDAWSSVRCQSIGNRYRNAGCEEQNGLLGRHPSNGATWGYAMGAAGVQTGINLLWGHFTRKHGEKQTGRVLEGFWTAPFLIYEGFNIDSNVKVGDYLKRVGTPR